jgi:hypothetical protein
VEDVMSATSVYLVDRVVEPPRIEHEVEVSLERGQYPQLLRYAGMYWVFWSGPLGGVRYAKYYKVERMFVPKEEVRR